MVSTVKGFHCILNNIYYTCTCIHVDQHIHILYTIEHVVDKQETLLSKDRKFGKPVHVDGLKRSPNKFSEPAGKAM